ncbi:unnamed protein product [Victoria cruziana]
MSVLSTMVIQPFVSLRLSKDSGFLYPHPANLPERKRSLRRRILALSLRPDRSESPQPEPPTSSLRLAASAILFLTVGVRACIACSLSNPNDKRAMDHLPPPSVTETRLDGHTLESHPDDVEITDEELKSAFEKWRSKAYSLTVPLRVIALRGSVPPAWVKDFIQVQGKRLKFQVEFRSTLDAIYQELSSASKERHVSVKSTIAADIITLADSWLDMAIRGGIIESLGDAEKSDWFNCLSDKWKAYLRRNDGGELDPNGRIWGVPYRWGCMVIAYKKTKFKKHNFAPIEDWSDLWRPELAGKISMVDSPREVVGAVLKYMQGSYNTKNFATEISGGRDAVFHNLTALQRQVRLFDSVHYLKALGAGDVWVAVGWSSDILPAAKRLSDVVVVVPKSGTSLWADLWAIPAATGLVTEQIGGRVRGPSPLVHQWFEFCLQAARGLPLQQEVIPGALASSLGDAPLTKSVQYVHNDEPQLETNFVAGMPPPEILERCEFLEPLPEATLEDYKQLLRETQKPGISWMNYICKSFSGNFSASDVNLRSS